MLPDRPTRSLTRMSWIILGVIVLLGVVYYLTHGFGAPTSIRP